MEKTYQMLWDCTYCGQKKLLGLSHRFCPGCGAPQNAALRYYPSDAEKVAVEDHRYAGADLKCPACNHYNSRLANNCVNCGGPMAGGKEAATREAQSVAQGMAFQGGAPQSAQAASFGQGMPPGRAPAPAKSSSLGLVIGIIVAVVVGMGLIGVFCWKRDAAFEVTGQSWERTIDVEVYGPVRKKAWCEDVPVGAKITDRSKEKRSTKKVPDGQDCRMVRKDMGDGTYKEKEECKPKYREEPVYADRCEYEVIEWVRKRQLTARGASTSETPVWPDAGGLRKGSCVGCEREGPRAETYTVHFKDAKGGEARECTFPQEKWATFAPGSRWQGKQAVMTGSIDCDTLRKP